MNALSQHFLDVRQIREEFPNLAVQVNGKPLVYLDNAATTHRPRAVLAAMNEFYTEYNSNVNRGVHLLSQKATLAYENARKTAQLFLNARSTREIVFTKGCTDGLNLLASSLSKWLLKPGDEVLLSTMEHHSNIVPWQLAGATLRVAPISDRGELLLEETLNLITERTKIVSIMHVSNVLGTINPIDKIVEKAHQVGAIVVCDGAQAAPHLPIDVQELGVDFYVIAGHKVYGPTGIGILYGREELLEKMPPYQGGGDMIRTVSFESTTFNQLPYKFEAGTPNIAGAIGLGVALDFVTSIGREQVAAYEKELMDYALNRLGELNDVRLIGTAQEKAGAISFVMECAHPHDIGTILDAEGVAIRTGHHCCMPLMKRLKVPATARASLAMYNTKEEIDTLVNGIQKVREIFA